MPIKFDYSNTDLMKDPDNQPFREFLFTDVSGRGYLTLNFVLTGWVLSEKLGNYHSNPNTKVELSDEDIETFIEFYEGILSDPSLASYLFLIRETTRLCKGLIVWYTPSFLEVFKNG